MKTWLREHQNEVLAGVGVAGLWVAVIALGNYDKQFISLVVSLTICAAGACLAARVR